MKFTRIGQCKVFTLQKLQAAAAFNVYSILRTTYVFSYAISFFHCFHILGIIRRKIKLSKAFYNPTNKIENLKLPKVYSKTMKTCLFALQYFSWFNFYIHGIITRNI